MTNLVIGYLDAGIFEPVYRTTAVDAYGQELAVSYCSIRDGLSPNQWCVKPIRAGQYRSVEHLTTAELGCEFDDVANEPLQYDEFLVY